MSIIAFLDDQAPCGTSQRGDITMQRLFGTFLVCFSLCQAVAADRPLDKETLEAYARRRPGRTNRRPAS